MQTFTREGYGRIYVPLPSDIDKVHAIIKGMNAFEYGYLPTGFITVFSNYPQVVYNHRFCDLHLNALTRRCRQEGISIFCFDAGMTQYPPPLSPPFTLPHS